MTMGGMECKCPTALEPELRDAWDTHLERNALRVGPKDTDAGAFLSWMIEAAGDILREASGHPCPSMGYIDEKIKRIRREVRSRDWRDPLSPQEQTNVDLVSKELTKLEPVTKEMKAVKALLDSIANRHPKSVEENLRNTEELIRRMSKPFC